MAITAKDSVGAWLRHPVGGPLIRAALGEAGVDEAALAPVSWLSLARVASMAGDRIPPGVIDQLVARANA